MVENGITIGLLSTSQDSGLVTQTMLEMGLDIPSTEVVALITAGNAEGRAKNKFADRAILALGEAGITQISEIDMADMPFDEVKDRFTPTSSHTNRLLVITGGDKRYLQSHLVLSGAQELIKEQVTAGTLPVLTISAGTSVMGQHLSVESEYPPGEQTGMGIVPATLVSHFDDKKERQIWSQIMNRGQLYNDTIVGIANNQALVGRSVDRFRVVGEGEVTVFYPEPVSNLPQTITGNHQIHRKRTLILPNAQR